MFKHVSMFDAVPTTARDAAIINVIGGATTYGISINKVMAACDGCHAKDIPLDVYGFVKEHVHYEHPPYKCPYGGHPPHKIQIECSICANQYWQRMDSNTVSGHYGSAFALCIGAGVTIDIIKGQTAFVVDYPDGI